MRTDAIRRAYKAELQLPLKHNNERSDIDVKVVVVGLVVVTKNFF